jgi:hypothetical protein
MAMAVELSGKLIWLACSEKDMRSHARILKFGADVGCPGFL